MIRYHGGPITPEPAALAAWRGSHAMVSFANPDQAALAFAVADSVAFDNGAWPIFSSGKGEIDLPAYVNWVAMWCRHPAFDWCLIPDKIDGDEEENDLLLRTFSSALARQLGVWEARILSLQVPVWHMHESIGRLSRLVKDWDRIAIGSSGEFVNIGTCRWWGRIAEAMELLCDAEGRPTVKLHGLRQMDPEVFSIIPYSSVDSTNVARNIGIDSAWTGSYVPVRKETRAMVLRSNIESHAASARWPGHAGIPRNLELYG
jgi:hypothetical protein